MSLHHVFAGERLTAFSDAVFAIVATIMVGTESLFIDNKYYHCLSWQVIPFKVESSDVDSVSYIYCM